ncbi:hypothetical protein TELCIR_02047 [Teladorsagia circumcincta]|uniref:TIL domain-containing protein n=1 Tax=Teladorsagia circumcincta TaxID=45464 RepID=A0A2G9V2D7_TELCI|nr:hypothetical protein TELCIR_02047 [Teladorsagia circumcincta]
MLPAIELFNSSKPAVLSVFLAVNTCTKQCIVNVCQCKQGFVRDISNVCVPQQDCPQDLPNDQGNFTM